MIRVWRENSGFYGNNSRTPPFHEFSQLTEFNLRVENEKLIPISPLTPSTQIKSLQNYFQSHTWHPNYLKSFSKITKLSKPPNKLKRKFIRIILKLNLIFNKIFQGKFLKLKKKFFLRFN